MLTRGTAGFLARGAFQVDLSFRHSDLSQRRLGTEPTDTVVRPKVFIEREVLVPGYHEDLQGSENYLQLDLAWGAGQKTTVFASMPIFGQKDYEIGHGGTGSSYNIRGLGDLVVGARRALVSSPQRSLVLSLGLKVPTGKNGIIDDFDETILDPTLQPGTGSGDVIPSLQWSTLGPAGTQLSLSGSYQINTTNDYKYRFGNEVITALTASRVFGRLTPSLQVKLNVRGRSSFVEEDVPSTGATVLYMNAGLRARTADAFGFYGFLLVPVYKDVNEAQLAARYSVLLGFSKTF
jgi:hypothetical protein